MNMYVYMSGIFGVFPMNLIHILLNFIKKSKNDKKTNNLKQLSINYQLISSISINNVLL